MKLPSLHSMNLFRKRDKQKARSGSDGCPNGSLGPADQNYLAYGTPSGPEFVVPGGGRDASSSSRLFRSSGGGGTSRLRSRSFKGLRGFGSSSRRHSGSAGDSAGSRASSRRRSVVGPVATAASAGLLLKLPDTVLKRIFAGVCPHSRDRSYDTCEDSSIGYACMLCDMRDLAHCAQVCSRWRPIVEQVLYVSHVWRSCFP